MQKNNINMKANHLSLILASTSPYRKMLLERLIQGFLQIDPQIDEEIYKKEAQSPKELSRLLSLKKAQAVFSMYPDSYVLGGDQVACDTHGNIFGKPGTSDNAFKTLKLLSGSTHFLHSSYALLGPGNHQEIVTVTTTLTMRALSDTLIQNYILKDNPIDTAGAYKIEALGIALFDSIKSSDFTAITGLPLIKLTQSLGAIGFQIP